MFTTHADAVVAFDAAREYLLPHHKTAAEFRAMKNTSPHIYAKPYIDHAKKIAKIAVSIHDKEEV